MGSAMTKERKWKLFFTPMMLDQYSKKDIWAGLGITSFAMLGIFAVSIIFGFIEITHSSFHFKDIIYYTGLILLPYFYPPLLFVRAHTGRAPTFHLLYIYVSGLSTGFFRIYQKSMQT